MVRIEPSLAVTAEVTVPGDKSLTHRGILFGALAHGETLVHAPLDAADTRSTAGAVAAMGAGVTWADGLIRIQGCGGLEEPQGVLDCGNSGTTMRLLMGALAGRSGLFVLDGDASLRRRPMRRVAGPLRDMGANVLGRQGGALAPLVLAGGDLRGTSFDLPVASAQVKSALIIAGLRAAGRTVVVEPGDSRDHTERLLPLFGAVLERGHRRVEVTGPQTLHGADLEIPGDPSSAAFWWTLGAILPGSEVRTPRVGLNPTRIGYLDVLRRYGADVRIDVACEGPEPFGTVTVAHRVCRGVTVGADEVPRLVDELPLVAVLGAFAEGITHVEGAEELRVKESDRIKAMTHGLRGLGGSIEERPDGFVVAGGGVRGGSADSAGDHRIAMALAIAAAAAESPSTISGEDAVTISYPTFFTTLQKIARART